MKLPILDLTRKKTGDASLPAQFNEDYRPDLIARAVRKLHSTARQPHGLAPEAGMRHSTPISKRRRNYRGCYGIGISRIARKIHSKRGTRMGWVGAVSPQAVGGRTAHPPKAETIHMQKINKKENRKAIRSAMGATINKVLVQLRGHQIPTEYPFVIDASFEQLQKTKDVEKVLLSLGFDQELERTSVRNIRAGRGKLRGRKYKTKKGLLIVVSAICPLIAAAQNLPGLDIIPVNSLNAEVLAPGTLPGRVTLWTTKALDELQNTKLYL